MPFERLHGRHCFKNPQPPETALWVAGWSAFHLPETMKPAATIPMPLAGTQAPPPIQEVFFRIPLFLVAIHSQQLMVRAE
jgi:hypothetical protein